MTYRASWIEQQCKFENLIKFYKLQCKYKDFMNNFFTET